MSQFKLYQIQCIIISIFENGLVIKMKDINQEILNKYAAGKCSEEELLGVEKWLNDDSWDSIAQEEPDLDSVENKIWTALDKDITPIKRLNWKLISVAASLVVLLGVSYIFFSAKTLDAHSFSNESFDQVLTFDKDNYAVLLSGNSNANIDLINNKLIFSGDFIIKPKKDFALLDVNQNTLIFKAGREYFVSNSPDFGEIVAFQKSDLAFLPLSMQTKIREQFQQI